MMKLEKHPLNQNFTWPAHTGPFKAVTPAQAQQYDEMGYFLLEDAFDTASIDKLIKALNKQDWLTEAFLRLQKGRKLDIARAGEITFSPHVVSRSSVARKFAKHPLFGGLCHDLIGPDARLYWDQIVYKKPGAKDEFPWHQDNGYTFIEPQAYLTCWVALTDTSIDNGCPWVIPKAHLNGTYRHHRTELGFVCTDEIDDAIAVPAKAGSIVVFSSLTPHRTGPNLTDQTRKSYILQYAPDNAQTVTDDGSLGALQHHPKRQFSVLKQGKIVV